MFSENVLVELLGAVVLVRHFTQSRQVVVDRHRDSAVVRLVRVRLVTCSLQRQIVVLLYTTTSPLHTTVSTVVWPGGVTVTTLDL